MNLLELRGLKKHFPIGSAIPLIQKRKTVKAVDGVDLTIARGETLAIVGESGSGKTTLGRVALGLQQPTAGEVWFDGARLIDRSAEEQRKLRRKMQIVFQDPFGSLNPRLPIGDQIEEGLVAHAMGTPSERKNRMHSALEIVGLPQEYAVRYPHEFSGGQRQRIGIARALALDPEFVVLDEPVSALDVSIQSQVLNLLADLRAKQGLTYMFISHNLDVVGYFADRVAVMYLGKVVESGPVDHVFTKPQHPYTIALLSAVPKIEEHDTADRLILEGRSHRQSTHHPVAASAPAAGCASSSATQSAALPKSQHSPRRRAILTLQLPVTSHLRMVPPRPQRLVAPRRRLPPRRSQSPYLACTELRAPELLQQARRNRGTP